MPNLRREDIAIHTYEQIAKRFKINDIGELERTGDKRGVKLGSKKRSGYIATQFEGVCYRISHLLFMLEHKRWPAYIIRYKDGNPSNVTIHNIVEATEENNCGTKNFKFTHPVKDSFGNVYSSVADAARSVGRSYKSVSNAINDKTQCAGRGWERIPYAKD